MKKGLKIALIIVICFIALALLLGSLLAGCLLGAGGAGDWTYDALPKNYEVWRVNSLDMVIGQREDSGLTHSVEGYVNKFCYNDDFIAVQILHLDRSLSAQEQKLFIARAENSEFWLIDANTDEVFGPYDFSGFGEICTEKNVGELCEWISTATAPEGSHY